MSKGSQVTTTTSSSLQSHAIARRSLRSSGARGPRVVAFAQGASTGDGSLTPKSKGMGSFAKRVLFGLILGGTGGSVLIAGGFPWACLVSLVAYQASQEYFGFITSKGIAAGMQPPPYHVTSIISLAAVGMSFGTFLTRGRTGTCLAVAAFLVISTQLLLVEKPKFSQLSSSIFGLFYCGVSPPLLVPCQPLAPTLQHPPLHTGNACGFVPSLAGRCGNSPCRVPPCLLDQVAHAEPPSSTHS